MPVHRQPQPPTISQEIPDHFEPTYSWMWKKFKEGSRALITDVRVKSGPLQTFTGIFKTPIVAGCSAALAQAAWDGAWGWSDVAVAMSSMAVSGMLDTCAKPIFFFIDRRQTTTGYVTIDGQEQEQAICQTAWLVITETLPFRSEKLAAWVGALKTPIIATAAIGGLALAQSSIENFGILPAETGITIGASFIFDTFWKGAHRFLDAAQETCCVSESQSHSDSDSDSELKPSPLPGYGQDYPTSLLIRSY